MVNCECCYCGIEVKAVSVDDDVYCELCQEDHNNDYDTTNNYENDDDDDVEFDNEFAELDF